MNYNQLSQEAKETIKVMVEYCINHGVCMGMDEGIACFNSGKKHRFRKELEAFSAPNNINKDNKITGKKPVLGIDLLYKEMINRR